MKLVTPYVVVYIQLSKYIINAFLHVLEVWMVKTESTGPILEAIPLKLVSPRTNQNYI